RNRRAWHASSAPSRSAPSKLPGPLLEEVLDPIHPALGLRAVLRIGEGRLELAQHGLLLLAQAHRCLHEDMRVEIARIGRAQALDPLAAQAEGLAGLRSLGQVDLGPPAQQGHPHFTAEGGRCHGDGNLAVEVVAVALEHRVLAYADLDEQVARRTAVDPGLAVAGRADPHPVLDPGGNVDLQGLLLLDAPLPVAFGAGIGNDLAAAPARRARLLDREEALLDAHAPLPVAGVARLGLRARLRARALAAGAAIPRRHADLGDVPVGRLLERDLHRVAQVGAAVDVAAAAGAARAEDVPEDVPEHVREAARAAATAGKAAGVG